MDVTHTFAAPTGDEVQRPDSPALEIGRPVTPVEPKIADVIVVRRGWRRWCTLATVFVVGAMVIAAFFHNEFRSQNWDPMQTRVYVERTLRYGGTFYENGLVNKGPFEPMVYRLAAAVTSYDGFWYAISALIIVVSAIIAWAASATTRAFGGHRLLGVAVGIMVFYHFALGKADYAGVLYSRNMIVGLFAGAWLIALSRRWWTASRAPWAAAAVGVLIGLGVQTLFVSGLAALGVWWLAWSGLDDLDDEPVYRRSRRILVATPIVVFLSAPFYYALRGRFGEFWSEYWTYNVYQNVATGRSLANQLVYGRDAILRYYRAWPMSLVIVVAFVVFAAALWTTFNRRERAIHIGISIWFVGAWTELVLSQRYSSHYFSVLALPTALMAATVIGHTYRLVTRERGEFRTVAAWPLLAALLAITAGGGQHLDLGLQAASSFTSVHEVTEQRAANEPGKQRTVRAVLDLASAPGDPLLAWTEYPWTYLNYHRVAATRWIWKSFMLGQIYLGRSGPSYVLPRTWEWFDDDIRESKPAAFLEEVALPVTEGTPFADYVNANFRPVFEGTDNIVHLRNDEADAILDGDPGETFTPEPRVGDSSNWTVGNGTASLPADTPPSNTDVLGLSDSLCTRISGTLTPDPAANGSFLSFRFDNADGTTGNARLNVADMQVFSGSDTSVFDTLNLDPATVDTGAAQTPVYEPREFAVVVGARSAALVIDGAILAAVRLDGQSKLSLEARSGGVEITDLRRGDPPPNSGCD